MSQSPTSPPQRNTDQPNSYTLAEYHKLAATGHFTPATSGPPQAPMHPQNANVQDAGIPGSWLPAHPEQRAQNALPVGPSPMYVYNSKNPPPAIHIPPRDAAALPVATATAYVPPRLAPAGGFHTAPQGILGSSVTTSSPYVNVSPAPRAPYYPPLRASTASSMSSVSPYSTAPPTPQTATTNFPNLQTATANVPNSQTQGPIYGGADAHMPWLASRMPLMQPQAIPPNSITLDGLCDRITFLLRRILPTVWTANNLTMLATSLANSIIFLGRSGQLGPDGLSSYSDIFMVIGYEGKGPCRYLGLAVMAPVQLRILMRTGSYDVRGRDPMRDRDCLQHMKDGFHNVAMDQWKTVQESINKSRRLR